MDIRFTEQQEKWKREVIEFLEKEMTPEFLEELEQGDHATFSAFSLPFSKKLAARGWLGLAWPKEYGGQDRSYIDHAIFREQMGYFMAPTGAHQLAVDMIGPALIRYGTEEQKKWWLPRIVKGEVTFCQGFTEPEAGSDLGSLRTRAEPVGNEYVINGEKAFSSGAHHSDYMYLATRTDPTAPKHKGISIFLVSTSSPGVTIVPMRTMNHGRVNQVYLDNVHVPAENMMGEKNKGWGLLMGALGVERSGVEVAAFRRRIFDELVAYAKETRRDGRLLIEDPIIRYRLAEWEINIEVAKMLCWRVVWMRSKGETPSAETTVQSLFDRVSEHTFFNFAMEILGLYGQLRRESKYARLFGLIERRYLKSCAITGAGAIPDISRTTIAVRGLGMPRERIAVS